MDSLSNKDLWLSLTCTLNSLDQVQQEFELRGWLNFFWQDANLSKPKAEEQFRIEDESKLPVMLSAIFENAREMSLEGNPTFAYHADEKFIRMTIQFTATFSQLFNLAKFPFDRQFLTAILCVRTSAFNLLSKAPSFVPDIYNYRNMVTISFSPSISGWDPASPVVSSFSASQTLNKRIAISLRVERRPVFWLTNIVFPIFIIVSIAPATFAVAPENLADRLGIILTLLLTLVTFKFVIAGEVPKISVITLLDAYITIGYIIMLAITLASLWGYFQTDLVCDEHFWLSPCLFPAVVIELFWIFFHIWILFMSMGGKFYTPWNRMKPETTLFRKFLVSEEKDIRI